MEGLFHWNYFLYSALLCQLTWNVCICKLKVIWISKKSLLTWEQVLLLFCAACLPSPHCLIPQYSSKAESQKEQHVPLYLSFFPSAFLLLFSENSSKDCVRRLFTRSVHLPFFLIEESTFYFRCMCYGCPRRLCELQPSCSWAGWPFGTHCPPTGSPRQGPRSVATAEDYMPQMKGAKIPEGALLVSLQEKWACSCLEQPWRCFTAQWCQAVWCARVWPQSCAHTTAPQSSTKLHRAPGSLTPPKLSKEAWSRSLSWCQMQVFAPPSTALEVKAAPTSSVSTSKDRQAHLCNPDKHHAGDSEDQGRWAAFHFCFLCFR